MSRPVRPSHIDIDALKRERPLADVIASYGIELRREGNATYRCLCPFHRERTPSRRLRRGPPAAAVRTSCARTTTQGAKR
jgi:hypothetical protein